MARKPGDRSHLDKETVAKLRDDIRGGFSNKQIAEKYGITEVNAAYHRKVVRENPAPKPLGRPPKEAYMPNPGENMYPALEGKSQEEALNAMNEDIRNGMSEADVVAKYGVGKSTFWNRRRELREEEKSVKLTPEQRPRFVQVISKIAEKNPDFFDDIAAFIMKKNPTAILEAI